MIQELITVLNEAISALPVVTRHGLVQVIGGSPHAHRGNGNWVPVTMDTDGPWSYWRITDKMRVVHEDIGTACAGVRVTIPLRLVALLKRSDCNDMPDLLIKGAGQIRDSKRTAQTRTGTATVLFPSIQCGVDQVIAQEYNTDPGIPTDRTLVNIDADVVLIGDSACLTICQ